MDKIVRVQPKKVQPVTINREDIANIIEALYRVTTGERRQGIIDVAIALGCEVHELPLQKAD